MYFSSFQVLILTLIWALPRKGGLTWSIVASRIRMKLFSLFLHPYGDNIDSRIIITTKDHDIVSLEFLDSVSFYANLEI